MSSTPAHPWLRYRAYRIRRSDLRRSRFWLSLLAYFAVVAPVFWLLRPQSTHSNWLGLLWIAFLFSLPLLANALRRLIDPAFYTGRQNDPPPRPLAEQFAIRRRRGHPQLCLALRPSDRVNCNELGEPNWRRPSGTASALAGLEVWRGRRSKP